MPHPCKSSEDAGGNPDRMHACANQHSTKTLCHLDVEPGTVDVLAGYTAVCVECFPRNRGQGGAPGDPIENRR
jgi:hypothetical protein